MHDSKPAISATCDKHDVLNTAAAIGYHSIVLMRLSYSPHFFAEVELLTQMADGGDGHMRRLNVRNGTVTGLPALHCGYAESAPSAADFLSAVSTEMFAAILRTLILRK